MARYRPVAVVLDEPLDGLWQTTYFGVRIGVARTVPLGDVLYDYLLVCRLW